MRTQRLRRRVRFLVRVTKGKKNTTRIWVVCGDASRVFRLWRIFAHSAPGERAPRSTSGKCEPSDCVAGRDSSYESPKGKRKSRTDVLQVREFAVRGKGCTKRSAYFITERFTPHYARCARRASVCEPMRTKAESVA